MFSGRLVWDKMFTGRLVGGRSIQAPNLIGVTTVDGGTTIGMTALVC